MMPQAFHQMTAACALISGTLTPQALSADRDTLRANAEQSRREQRVLVYRIFFLAIAVALVGYWIWAIGMMAQGARTQPVFTFAFGLPLVLAGLVFALYLLAGGIGQQVAIVHAMESWAGLLGGISGTGPMEPVLEWMSRHWGWFAPPFFLARETAWAAGSWNGRPILITSERDDSRFVGTAVAAIAFIQATGRHHRLIPGASTLNRVSLFVSGAALRQDAAAAAIVGELASWGYGIVGTPAGIYIYGASYERGLRPEFLRRVLEKAMLATATSNQNVEHSHATAQ